MGFLVRSLEWVLIAVNVFGYMRLRAAPDTASKDRIRNRMVWFNLANVAIALYIFGVTS